MASLERSGRDGEDTPPKARADLRQDRFERGQATSIRIPSRVDPVQVLDGKAMSLRGLGGDGSGGDVGGSGGKGHGIYLAGKRSSTHLEPSAGPTISSMPNHRASRRLSLPSYVAAGGKRLVVPAAPAISHALCFLGLVVAA